MRLPADLSAAPVSVYLWGSSRRAVNVLAHTLAHSVDDGFLWLSIRAEDTIVTEDELWQSRLLGPGRLLPSVAPEDLRPDHAGSNLAAWTTIRATGNAEGGDLGSLLDFLRLPARLKGVAEEIELQRERRCLVVTNTERVRPFYPTEPEGLRPFCRALTSRGVSLIVTSVLPANPGRFAFDLVARVENFPDEAWRTGRVAIEQGFAAPPLRSGASIDLAELPEYRYAAESIDRALHLPEAPGPAAPGLGLSDPPKTSARRDRAR